MLRGMIKCQQQTLFLKSFQNKRKVDVKGKIIKTFTEIFDQFVIEKPFSAATKKLNKNLQDQLLECFPRLNIEEFDLKDWATFRYFLRSTKRHARNTICIRLNKLKALIKYLKSLGHEIPIQNFPLPQEEIKKIFLDLKDICFDT